MFSVLSVATKTVFSVIVRAVTETVAQKTVFSVLSVAKKSVIRGVWAAASLVAERDDRVHLRGATRGKIAGE